MTVDYDDVQEPKHEVVNDWQNNYENSSTDQIDDVLEFEVADCDQNSQTIDESVSNEIDQRQPIIEEVELINRLEEERPNRFQQFFREVEIESAGGPKKRKNMDVADVKLDKSLAEPDNSVPCERTTVDVMVSSSTSKSDESATGSLHITTEEDKYFSLALMGILQRIPPQKKAFAKVNILRYLTELEYGVEATI